MFIRVIFKSDSVIFKSAIVLIFNTSASFNQEKRQVWDLIVDQ